MAPAFLLAEYAAVIDTGTREDLARLLAIDLELNAQGTAIWLDRSAR